MCGGSASATRRCRARSLCRAAGALAAATSPTRYCRAPHRSFVDHDASGHDRAEHLTGQVLGDGEVGVAGTLALLLIRVGTVQEDHHVRVLLDRTELAQIRENGLLVRAARARTLPVPAPRTPSVGRRSRSHRGNAGGSPKRPATGFPPSPGAGGSVELGAGGDNVRRVSITPAVMTLAGRCRGRGNRRIVPTANARSMPDAASGPSVDVTRTPPPPAARRAAAGRPSHPTRGW